MNGLLESVQSRLNAFLSYNTLEPLLFTQVDFWLFFLVIGVGFLFVRSRITIRSVYLLLCSLFFYYKTCGLFFLLILVSIAFNFFAARLIADADKTRIRKAIVTCTVGLNLLLLAYFKYATFFVDTLNALFGTSIEVQHTLGTAISALLGGDPSVPAVILPVGISFYTFQAISYVVDVYRCQVEPLRRITDFGFYLSFFPQLVAGPIVRASEFIPQIYQPYRITQREASHALFIIITGLFKKVVLSDYIALNFVDRVFSDPLAYSGVENLAATYGYALQIYCDFSGYTDIAIGVALQLGFRLSINFNFPYRASTLTDFWRRWHISLSTWLRDYLYIPLGGNRHGFPLMLLALFITMLLGGLWHGASWTFVLWGALHGLGLIVSKLIDRLPFKWLSSRVVVFLRGVITFHVVCFLWILFRASDVSTARQVVGQIATHFNPAHLFQLVLSYRVVLLLMLLGYALHWLPTRWIEQLRGAFINAPVVVKFVVTLAMAMIVLNVQRAGLQPFIYFDF